jgi:hypothetical protein
MVKNQIEVIFMDTKSKKVIKFIKIFVGAVIGLPFVDWLLDSFVWKRNDWNLYEEIIAGVVVGILSAFTLVRQKNSKSKIFPLIVCLLIAAAYLVVWLRNVIRKGELYFDLPSAVLMIIIFGLIWIGWIGSKISLKKKATK